MEVLETEAQMGNWNDGRLDQFERRVDERFNEVDERFKRVDERFDRIEERLAETPTRKEMNDGFAEIRGAVLGLHRTLIASAIAIILALIGFHG